MQRKAPPPFRGLSPARRLAAFAVLGRVKGGIAHDAAARPTTSFIICEHIEQAIQHFSGAMPRPARMSLGASGYANALRPKPIRSHQPSLTRPAATGAAKCRSHESAAVITGTPPAAAFTARTVS
jgi:hypothetical protein